MTAPSAAPSGTDVACGGLKGRSGGSWRRRRSARLLGPQDRAVATVGPDRGDRKGNKGRGGRARRDAGDAAAAADDDDDASSPAEGSVVARRLRGE